MKLVFMGTAAFAVPALKAVKSAGHEVLLVVCQPDRPKGRGHETQAPPLKLAALELGLQVFQPEKVREASALERLLALRFDALCVVAYGQILPKALLDAPRLMPLNVHASLLPKYRGAAPIEWALANGESETGVCVQKMAEKLDAGDVMMQDSVSLGPDDDAASITPRLSEMGARLLVEALSALERGEFKLKPQDEALASFAPLLKKSHGIADFSLGKTELLNRFRGFKARPGFYTALAGETLKIHALSPVEGSPVEGQGKPGELLEISAEGLKVGCHDGAVRIGALQSPGGKAMPAADWARGRKAAVGIQFQNPAF
jgi:methionyl-tRNA formyltransferase